MGNGLDNFVAAAAGVALAAAPMAAHAADKTSAVLNTAHPVSQVAEVSAANALKAELLGVLSPVWLKDFNNLPPEAQNSVAFFYGGFKKEKPEDKAYQVKGVEQVVFLFSSNENNKKSLVAMKAQPNVVMPLQTVKKPITALSDPKTYGTLLVSSNSEYSQKFVQIRDEALKIYEETKPLQEAAMKLDSPELVAINKKRDESRIALETSRRELATSRSELATSRATLQTLQTINQSFAGK